MKNFILYVLFTSSLLAICSPEVVERNGHYYQFQKTALDWNSAKIYAESMGAYLAIPDDIDENNWFYTNGWAESWIGIYDYGMETNYCYNLDSCMSTPNRYRTVKNTSLAFSNWDMTYNEPNNYVSLYDHDANGIPLVDPLGEHWVYLARDGKWSDYGNHYGTGYDTIFKAYSIFEYDTPPDCFTSVATDVNILPTEPFCPIDRDGDLLAEITGECAIGNPVNSCKDDIIKCEPTYIEPKCLNNGILEINRDTCQLDGDIACPSGYTFDPYTDTCHMDVLCPQSPDAGYDNNLGKCIGEWSSLCDAGLTLQSNLCIANPTCASPGTYNLAKNRCEAPVECQSGVYDPIQDNCVEILGDAERTCSALSGFIPYAVVDCSGFTMEDIPNMVFASVAEGLPGDSFSINFFNGTFGNNCEVGSLNNSFTCQLGYNEGMHIDGLYVFAAASKDPICSNGSVPVSGKCEIRTEPSCLAGYAIDTTTNSCYLSATCPSGSTLNQATDKCEKTFIKDCPTGSIFDSTLNMCLGTTDCGVGYLDTLTSRCIIPNTINENTCPIGYNYSPFPIGMCEAIPICNEGVYIETLNSVPKPWQNTTQHTQENKCYVGDISCPYGSTQPCTAIPLLGYINHCSPWTCVTPGEISLYGGVLGENDKADDGVIDENGCNGNIYIYNGRDLRCRSWDAFAGLSGGECCSDDKTFFNTLDCTGDEILLSSNKGDGLCSYIGDYCSEKIDNLLGKRICIKKKKTYCCFNSMLGRILHEQGRVQLGITWGTGKSPECRGFKPEEFEKIDFSIIDFSEFEATVSVVPTSSNINDSTYDNDRADNIDKITNAVK